MVNFFSSLKQENYVLFASGLLSFLVCVATMLYSFVISKKGIKDKKILSPIQLKTLGVFVASFIMFLPIDYQGSEYGDLVAYIRTAVVSFLDAIAVFLLNADFSAMPEYLQGQPHWLAVPCFVYFSILYLIAPVMTFGNVLALCKNVKGEIRFFLHKKKDYFIFSELNRKSVELAKSVYRKKSGAVIVFCNADADTEGKENELLPEVDEIKGICVKKDITKINIFSKKGNVEMFLVGDESDAAAQAVEITSELNKRNKKQNVKVFVFGQKESTAHIVDSIKYDKLLCYAEEHNYGDETFKLRRINEVNRLVLNTLPEMKLFDIAEKNGGAISVLLVGLGAQGMEFFKTILWYCQFEGVLLKINIVDSLSGEDGKGYIRSIINRHCPEILKRNRVKEDGDAYYDIEILPGIDIETDKLEEIAFYRGEDEDKTRLAQRLKETDIAIVSLGEDDLNIETAVYLRSLFDRIRGIKASNKMIADSEEVKIYSVVYNDGKTGLLQGDGSDTGVEFLVNHKDVGYHINFIGALSKQYDYDNLYDKELEKKAYEHHIGWVSTEEKIYNEWLKMGDKKNIEAHEWYFSGENTEEAKAKARENYERFEYYRDSSIAKELYQREIKTNSVLKKLSECIGEKGSQVCECENCVRRKRSEHFRWNTYARVNGYSYNNGVRADRAKFHDNLCSWNNISYLDKQKD